MRGAVIKCYGVAVYDLNYHEYTDGVYLFFDLIQWPSTSCYFLLCHKVSQLRVCMCPSVLDLLPPLTPAHPPGHHRLSSPCYAAASLGLAVSHAVVGVRQSCSLSSSHPLLRLPCSQSVLYACISILPCKQVHPCHFCRFHKKVLDAQSCSAVSNPVDCSPPGPSVYGILQARILEWVAIPFSR